MRGLPVRGLLDRRDLFINLGDVLFQAFDVGFRRAEHLARAFGGIGISSQLVLELGLGGLKLAEVGLNVAICAHDAFFLVVRLPAT